MNSSMDLLGWRIQLATLWLVQVLNFVSVIFVSYFETGLVTIYEPETVGMLLSVYFLLFAALIWLAFVLKAGIGRWVHLVFGALIVLLKASYVVQSLGGIESGAFLFNEVWGLVAAVLLVWVAWRLPKSE
jgi:hypothetical protein